jgi:hypothetical protein
MMGMQPQQHLQQQDNQQQQPHMTWQQITATLAQLLQPFGFDIVHAFPLQLFNSQSPPEHQLPTFNWPGSTLAVIIGNSNALWQPFLQQLARQPQLQEMQDPLDAYVEQHVTAAVQRCCCSCLSQASGSTQAGSMEEPAAVHQAAQECDCQQHQQQQQQEALAGQESIQPVTQQQQHQQQQQQQQQQQPSVVRHELRFSHHTGPKFVNMLRAAQLSGLAYYSSTTHLAMHARYGPWFALRAVAVFDCEGPNPADSAFDQMTCPYPELEQEAGQAMQKLEGLGGLANWQAHWRQWAELRGMGGKHTDPRCV